MKKKLVFGLLPFGMKKCLLFLLPMCLSATFASAQTWNPTGSNQSTGDLSIGKETDSDYSCIRLLGGNKPVGYGGDKEISFLRLKMPVVLVYELLEVKNGVPICNS